MLVLNIDDHLRHLTASTCNTRDRRRTEILNATRPGPKVGTTLVSGEDFRDRKVNPPLGAIIGKVGY